MAIQTRAYLKTRFETGDIPTEQDYIDLFDTYFSKADDTGSGLQLNGNNIDLNGPLSIPTTLIFDPNTNTFKIRNTSDDGGGLVFESGSFEFISRKDANNVFSAIGHAREPGILETENVPGVWLRVVNFPTNDKTAAIILRNDGIISIGSGLAIPSQFSRIRFNSDYSATWDALTEAERNRIIVDFEYQLNNFLSKKVTTDQSVAGNVTFDKNAGVKGLLIPFTNAPVFAVNNSNIQQMNVGSGLSSINIQGQSPFGNYRILLKNDPGGPFNYPALGTSFGEPTTNSESLDGTGKVMNYIDVQVTSEGIVTHSIETVTLP